MIQRFLVLTVFLSLSTPSFAVFIGDSAGNIYEHDQATNTSTFLGNTGVGAMFDIALNPFSNTLYGVSGGGNLYTIDKSNGGASFVGSTGAFINGLTFSSGGTLYGSGGNSLFTVDVGSASATVVGNTGFTSSGDIAFDDAGNLYMSALGGFGNDRLIAVDETTGVGTLLGAIGFGDVYGLNYLDSVLYGYTQAGQTISIDTATGAGTLLAINGIRAFGADGAGGVAVVPEPQTLLLLAIGLLGLGFSRLPARQQALRYAAA